MGLLAEDEPAPVVAERKASTAPWLLTCDHAGREVPRALGDLGVADGEMARHVAYDLGVWPVARELARALAAPVVAQPYSRLVIDCNRPTHVAASIPEVSERTEVPGNRGLSANARQARIDAVFRPYHDQIEAILDARAARGLPTILIAMHSFTPVYLDEERPWRLGLLYSDDDRLARPLLDILNHDTAPYTGDKRPYAVDDETDYTLPVHGAGRGLLHVGLEIRQDLIGDRFGQAAWVQWLELVLGRVLDRLPGEAFRP